MGAICTTGKVVEMDKTNLPRDSTSHLGAPNKLCLRAADIQSPAFSISLSPFRLTRSDAELILAEAKPGSYTLSHDLTSELFISQSAGKCVIHHSISKRGSVLFVGGESFKDVKGIIDHFKRHPLGDIKLTEELSTKSRTSLTNHFNDKLNSTRSDSSSGIHSHSSTSMKGAETTITNGPVEVAPKSIKRERAPTEASIPGYVEEKPLEEEDVVTTLTKPKHSQIANLQRSLSRASVSSAGEKDLPTDEPLPILPEPTGARPPPLYPRFSTLTRSLSSISLERTSDVFDLKHALFQLFKGNIMVNYPSQRRKIKLFFVGQNDTIRERQYLMESLLPNVCKTCSEYGYICEVLDTNMLHDSMDSNPTLTWAIDYGQEKLKNEINDCKTHQLPVIAIVFLGQRYGPLHFPLQLPLDTFKELQLKFKTKEAKDAMDKLYELNMNHTPPLYILRDQLTNEGINEERQLFEELLQMVFSSDKDGKEIWQYYAPGFQTDLHTIKSSIPDAQFVVIERTMEGLEKRTALPYEKFPVQYFDSPDANSYYQLQARQGELKEEVYRLVASKEEIFKYKVNLDNVLEEIEEPLQSGIIDKMQSLLQKKLTTLLSTRSAKAIDRWLQSEILYHVERSAFLSDKYSLPSNLKQTVKAYLEGPYRKPLVLYGGCQHDRATATANISKLSTQLLGDCCCVVTRYVGHTPDATSITLLFQSICLQLSRAYGTDPSAVPQDVKDLVTFMPILLQLATDSQPLVICLNDVHLVELKGSEYDVFSFLPARLGSFVKIIITGSVGIEVSAAKYFRDNNSFTVIPESTAEDALELMDQIMDSRDRSLSDDQKEVVKIALKSCPVPGMVKIVQKMAEDWRSDTLVKSLQHDVQDCFQAFTRKLEEKYESALVQEVFSYLTVANMGISEDCLIENVLIKCRSNEKLTKYNEHCKKYNIRQLLQSLGDLIHTETVHGDVVIRWSDDVYCSCVKASQLINSDKANVYISDIVKFVDKSRSTFKSQLDSSSDEDQIVLNTVYNLFKFTILLIYLLQLKRLDLLKSVVFCNYEYLRSKLHALSVNHIVDDLTTTLSIFPDQLYLSTLKETLELSSEALTFDPQQFAAQLLARLTVNTYPSIWRENTKSDSDISMEMSVRKPSKDVNGNIPNSDGIIGDAIGQMSVVTIDVRQLRNIDLNTTEELRSLLQVASESFSALLPSKQCLLRPKVLSLIDGEEQRKLHHYVSDVRFLFTNHDSDFLLAWSSSCDCILMFKGNCEYMKDIQGLSVKRIPFTIGSKAVLETRNGTIFYDLISEVTITKLDQNNCYFAVCDDSTVAAIKDDWKALALYNVYDKTCLWEYRAPEGKNFRNVLVSKHGTVGVCLTEDTGGQEGQFDANGTEAGSSSYSFSRDEMIVLNLATQKEMHKLRLKEGEFFYKVCSVSEDGKYLVHLTEPEKHLLVWDLYKGALLHELEIRPLRLLKIHVSSQGDCIVAVSADSFVRVWNLTDGTSRFVLSEPMRSIRGGYMDDTHCLCMSEDGQKAIHSVKSNFLYSYVVVWDLVKGKILGTFTTDFYGLTFDMNPRGDYIVTNMPTGIVSLQINEKLDDSVSRIAINQAGLN